MCAVARSYMMMDIVSEPFTQNHRKYVLVDPGKGRPPKQVRWYTDEEFAKMYPDIVEKSQHPKDYLRYVLGFKEAGYITIYYGTTYENLAWFKAEKVCRYHKIFGWYTISTEEVPATLPDGIKTTKLNWFDVCDESQEDINESKARTTIDKLIYAPSTSKFIGEVGERKEFTLCVKRVIPVETAYGHNSMHIMEDVEGNVYIWSTSAKTLEVNRTYFMKGKIKDHRIYHNTQQTIINYCTGIKEVS